MTLILQKVRETDGCCQLAAATREKDGPQGQVPSRALGAVPSLPCPHVSALFRKKMRPR